MDKSSTIVAFPAPRDPVSSQYTHPLVKSVTDVLVALGELARQVEKWPMDPERKLSMLSTIKALALQACELQLVAVTEVHDPEKFRADLNRVMTSLRVPGT